MNISKVNNISFGRLHLPKTPGNYKMVDIAKDHPYTYEEMIKTMSEIDEYTDEKDVFWETNVAALLGNGDSFDVSIKDKDNNTLANEVIQEDQFRWEGFPMINFFRKLSSAFGEKQPPRNPDDVFDSYE